MKKMKIFLYALLCSTGLYAADLTVAAQGKSVYAIVIPDQVPCYNIPRMAELLKEGFRRSTGAILPIVKESDYKGSAAIFIGPVKMLGTLPEMGKHEARLEVRKNQIFLYGSDRKYVNFNAKHHYLYEQGSARAVMLFMRKFLHADFLIPGNGMTGLAVPQAKKISVPDTLNLKDVPEIQYNIGSFHDLYYDIFNGHLVAPWYAEYGGHSYVRAVPYQKYGKTHPEYFALVKGKRLINQWNHLCISNPEVQKLIKAEVIHKMDLGYEVVELSQSDGFHPCECEKCKALFNTPDYGEKLWILHRRIAEELLKERPGKSVCIIAYGPTKNPPKSFKKFPSNVRIDLAPWNDKTWKAWRGYSVPGGFVCYDYIFGYFSEMGLTPKNSIAFLTRHARKLHRDKIRGIYRCGWGSGFGTDGPFYYIWNRIIQEPELEPYALLHDYCAKLFGDAAPEMEQFYRILDKQMHLTDKIANIDDNDYNDPTLFTSGWISSRNAVALLLKRWPVEVLNQLQKLLDKAEKKIPATDNMKFFWPVIKTEFNYFNLTIRTLDAMERVTKQQTAENCADLRRYWNLRLNCIKALPWINGKLPRHGNLRPFAGLKMSEIMQNGILRARITFRHKWQLEENQKIVPFGRVIHTGAEPQQLVGLFPKDNQNPALAVYPFFMQIQWDSTWLKIILTYPKGIPADGVIFVRAYFLNGSQRLRFQGAELWNQLHLRTKKSGVNGAMGDEFKGDILPTKFKIKNIDKHTTIITIPWSEIGIKPVKGMKIPFNFYCQYDHKLHYIWEFNLMQHYWYSAYDQSGTLILE